MIATELAGKVPGWDPCRVALIPVDGSAQIRLAKDGDELAPSADGKRLAYTVGNVVKIVALDSHYRFASVPVEVAKEPHAISSIHWSGDGRTLVYQVGSYTRAVTGGVAWLIRFSAPVEISQVLRNGSALGIEERGLSALWRVDLKAPHVEPERVRSIAWTDEHLTVSRW